MNEVASDRPAQEMESIPARRPHVVILGAGFGGLNAAQGLRNAPVDVTVVDRRNYHLFQPLLYQVATAALSPAQIATPIRRILARQKNATVLMEKIDGIDTQARLVITEKPPHRLRLSGGRNRRPPCLFRPRRMGRDGARPEDHRRRDGDPRPHPDGLRRGRSERRPDLRRKLLTFVIVGGGPTGVELAGAIAELARKAIVRDFRSIDSSTARVILVEAGPRLLTAFPERLSQSAKAQLEKLGVEVRLGHAVTRCDGHGVMLADGEPSARAACYGPPASWRRVPRHGWAPRQIAPDA